MPKLFANISVISNLSDQKSLSILYMTKTAENCHKAMPRAWFGDNRKS